MGIPWTELHYGGKETHVCTAFACKHVQTSHVYITLMYKHVLVYVLTLVTAAYAPTMHVKMGTILPNDSLRIVSICSQHRESVTPLSFRTYG